MAIAVFVTGCSEPMVGPTDELNAENDAPPFVLPSFRLPVANSVNAAYSSQFLVTPTGFDFGEVQVGETSPSMATTVTNVGTAAVVVSGAGGAPTGPFGGAQNCQGVTLNPGDSCEFSYTFSPSAVGAASGTSAFTLNGDPFEVDLKGTGVGPQFLVTPNGFDFGEVQVGATSAPMPATVTNVGTAPVVVSGAGGAPGGPFVGVQNCQGVTLNPGDSCAFTYTFSPVTAGPASASSNFSLNGVPFSVSLTGVGVNPKFLVTPTGHDFGEVQVGEMSASLTTNVTNVGTAPVVVSGAGGAPGAPFNGTQNCQGVTLNPGDSCAFFYTFSPTAAGAASTTSNFTLNGVAFSVALTGTGLAMGASPTAQFLVTPTGHDFGEVQVGEMSAPMPTTVTNVGTSAIVVSGAGGAPGAPFNGTQNCQGVTLNPGDSCEFFYTFSPTAAGAVTGSSNFSLNGVPFSVNLSGVGVNPKFLVTPTGHDFGGQAIGATSGQATTHVTNVGSAPVVVSGAGGAPGAPFNATQNCQGVTLNPGDSCAFFYTFSPTSGGPAAGASIFSLNSVPFQVNLAGFGLGDTEGPVTSAVSATPNPVEIGTLVNLTAIVDDQATGPSNIASAEYSLGGGPWMPMVATDLAFDEFIEDVSASVTAPAVAGIHEMCVRGTDAASNIGAPVCILLVVYDPSAGFVTGGGWFESPYGAFVGDPSLIGRATFGFVAKYLKGRSAPDGSTEFQFRAAGLDFHSASYEFLVINQGGTNAQFKGAGTINRIAAPNGTLFRFMIWASDGNPDTFRIKIWWEANGTEHVVYDNGSGQPIGGGSIMIHTR